MTERSHKARMLAGELYRAEGPELAADQLRAQSLLHRYNATPPEEAGARAALLAELCAAVGEGTVVRPPFFCDYGYNIRLGARVFLNYGCVVLDVVAVEIGDGCQVGPGVHIYAADHPRDAGLRRQGWENGRPVRIGANVWIGGAAVLLPGITVGDDAVIGAGSVVTRDVPPGATVVGNPAKPK